MDRGRAAVSGGSLGAFAGAALGWGDAARVMFGSVPGALQGFAVAPPVYAIIGTVLGAAVGAAVGRGLGARWPTRAALGLCGVGMVAGLGPWAQMPEAEFPDLPPYAERPAGRNLLWVMVDRFAPEDVEKLPELAAKSAVFDGVVPASTDPRLELATQLTGRWTPGHGADRGALRPGLPTVGAACGALRASALVLPEHADLGEGFHAVDMPAGPHPLGGGVATQALALWRGVAEVTGAILGARPSTLTEVALDRIESWGDEPWCLVVVLPTDAVSAAGSIETLVEASGERVVWSVSGRSGGTWPPRTVWMVGTHDGDMVGQVRHSVVSTVELASSLVAEAGYDEQDVWDGSPVLRGARAVAPRVVERVPDPVAQGLEGGCDHAYADTRLAMTQGEGRRWITNLAHGLQEGESTVMCDLLADPDCKQDLLGSNVSLCMGGQAQGRADALRAAADSLLTQSAEGAERQLSGSDSAVRVRLMPKPPALQQD